MATVNAQQVDVELLCGDCNQWSGFTRSEYERMRAEHGNKKAEHYLCGPCDLKRRLSSHFATPTPARSNRHELLDRKPDRGPYKRSREKTTW